MKQKEKLCKDAWNVLKAYQNLSPLRDFFDLEEESIEDRIEDKSRVKTLVEEHLKITQECIGKARTKCTFNVLQKLIALENINLLKSNPES